MGIDVILEDEERRSVQECFDSQNAFAQLLRANDLSATSCLRFIDAFGDTVFNRAQASVLSSELLDLKVRAGGVAAAYIENAIRLADLAARKTHLYVRFVGD